MVCETGALSALVTPVSVKGGQMQLVSQVNLSAVISVENTKNKTLRGIVWVSVLATPHVSRLPVSFSWTSLSPSSAGRCRFLRELAVEGVVQAQTPSPEGGRLELSRGPFDTKLQCRPEE